MTDLDRLDALAAGARRWHLGSMNDGLFIIDKPPSPSGTDVPPGIYPGDPDMVLNATALTEERAQAIADAHNAALVTLTSKIEEQAATIRELVAAVRERDELRAAAERLLRGLIAYRSEGGEMVSCVVVVQDVDALRAALHPEAGT